MKTIESVRTHVKKNKNVYIAGGVCLVVGAAVGVVAITKMSPNAEVVQKITQIGHHNTALMITFIEHSTPSKRLHLVDTNQYFDSISQAARELKIPLSTLSKHVNGHIPNVRGMVFEVITDDLAS
jgi:hypothetical protein